MKPEENISPQEILSQLRAIAMADVTQALSVQQGQLCVRDTDALPPEVRAAICGVEKSAGGLKLKFYDKLKALELLGKVLGLFDRDSQPDPGDNDLLQTILQSTKEVLTTHDLPEIQQAAAAGHDLVESAGLM